MRKENTDNPFRQTMGIEEGSLPPIPSRERWAKDFNIKNQSTNQSTDQSNSLLSLRNNQDPIYLIIIFVALFLLGFFLSIFVGNSIWMLIPSALLYRRGLARLWNK